MSIFNSPELTKEFDKAFNEIDSEKLSTGTGYTSLADEAYQFQQSQRIARDLAFQGKTTEELDLELVDPRYDALQKYHQRELEAWEKSQRIGKYATDPAEIERLRAAGHPEGELQRLQTLPEAPQDVLTQAQATDDPNAFLKEKGFRSMAPAAPERMTTRRKLRDEFKIPYSAIDSPPKSMTEIEYRQAQLRMVEGAQGRAVQGYGIREDGTEKPVGQAMDPGFLQKSSDALERGYYNLNTGAIALRFGLGAAFKASGEVTQVAGSAVPGGVGNLLGVLQNKVGDALLESATLNNIDLQMAKKGTRFDSDTGEVYSQEEQNIIEDFYYGSLESAPEFALTIAAALASGGGSVAAQTALKTVSKKTVNEALKRSAKKTTKMLLEQGVKSGGRAKAVKQIAKTRSRAFIGLSTQQSFSHQVSESADYYINKKGMDPYSASGVILTEGAMAATATALTTGVSSKFMFKNKVNEKMAQKAWGRTLNGFLIGYTSEGLQEATELIIADIALHYFNSIRGDEERAAQFSPWREGFFRDVAVAGLTGGALGGPAGIATRAGRPDPVRPGRTEYGPSPKTFEEQQEWTPDEIADYWTLKSRLFKERQREEIARQTAISKDRATDLSVIKDDDLLYAMLNPIADEKASMIFAGEGNDQFRVTPLIASLELIRRGKILEEGSVEQELITDYIQGPKSIGELSQRDLRTAADGGTIYYEARDGRRIKLPQSYANKEIERRKREGEPADGRPRLLKKDQADKYEKELLAGEPSEAALLGLIMSAPDLALQAIRAGDGEEGQFGRKLMNQMLGRMTGDPRERNTSVGLRKKIYRLLKNNEDAIAAEVENRQGVQRVPLQTPAGQPTRIAGRGARGRFTQLPPMSNLEAEAQARLDQEEAVSDTPAPLTFDDRNNIDRALDRELEDNNRDLLRDTSMSNQDVARALPSSIPFQKRLTRVRELRGRRGIENAITDRRAGATTMEGFPPTRQQSARESAQRGRDITQRKIDRRAGQEQALAERARPSALPGPLTEKGVAGYQSVQLTDSESTFFDDLVDMPAWANEIFPEFGIRYDKESKTLSFETREQYDKFVETISKEPTKDWIGQLPESMRGEEARARFEERTPPVMGEKIGRATSLVQTNQESLPEKARAQIGDVAFFEEYTEGSKELLSDIQLNGLADRSILTDDDLSLLDLQMSPEAAPEAVKADEEIAERLQKQNERDLGTIAKNEARGMENMSDEDLETEALEDLDILDQEGREATDDIDVVDEKGKVKAKGIRSKLLTPLHFTAIKAGIGSVPHKVVQKLIFYDLQRMKADLKELRTMKALWKAMPKEWTSDNGNKIAQLADQYTPLINDNAELDLDHEITVDEQKMKVGDLPQEVQAALLHIKQKSEQDRLELIAEKREVTKKMFTNFSAKDLVKAATTGENPAIPNLVREGKSQFTQNGILISKDQVIEKLVANRVPDDWGHQYAYFHHAWFGRYKLRAYDEEGNSYSVPGEANTAEEAYQALYDFKASPPQNLKNVKFTRFEAKPAYNEDPDFMSLSKAERSALQRALRSETDATSEEINDALFKARVKLKENRSPFFAPLLQRTGATGYSMNFPKVWTAYTRARNRHKYGRMMTKAAQPEITALKQKGNSFGQYLEDVLSNTLFTKQTGAEIMLDGLIQSIPGLRNSPMPTRRFLSGFRAFNFLRQLKTPRQWLVNSTQPLLTVYPVVGEKIFLQAARMHNTAEGRALLDKHGRMDSSAGMYIDGSVTSLGQKAIDVVTRGQELLDKHALRGKVSTQSELRNMNFSFIAFYLHGKSKGMSDTDAAEYATVQGYVGSQFMFTRANLPPILHSPIASTLLQYRRFQMNMIGYGLQLLKSKNYSGAGKWLALQAVIGGARGIVLTGLPLWWGISKIASLLGMSDEEEMDHQKMLASWHNGLKKRVGKTAADTFTFGLPGLIGIDLSGSTGLFQGNFGDSMPEVVWNQFKGPTGGFITDMSSAIFGSHKDVGDISRATASYRKFKDTSPTFKWLLGNVERLSGYHDEYDSRGQLRFRDEDKGRALWMELAGGFRTVNQSVMSLEYSRLQVLRAQEDKYKDRAAALLVDGKYKEAIETMNLFNSLYPDMSFNIDDLKRRFESKNKAKIENGLERFYGNASKGVRRQFIESQ